MKIGINGFGRIGRALFRILDARTDIELVAINDLFEPRTLMYLLKYDTVMGRFDGPLNLEDGVVVTTNTRARMLAEPDPALLPWKELGVDLVVPLGYDDGVVSTGLDLVELAAGPGEVFPAVRRVAHVGQEHLAVELELDRVHVVLAVIGR